MKELHVCCVLGHRKINETEKLKATLVDIIENLILNKGVDTFLFGSKSRFNDLCLEVVTKAKEKYPHIKRVYVRAEYPCINKEYENYLLERYEATYYPERLVNSGRAIYIERNYEIINKSRFCIVYYDRLYAPVNGKSGTATALNYALKKGKDIIMLPITK